MAEDPASTPPDSPAALDLFEEPADYFQPEKPTTKARHRLQSGQELTLRLVGHNPLWGHLLWNAGRTISTYLEQHAADLLENKTVLEFGAGSGLPSLVCALRGAERVVVTDYPDADLIENLRFNIASANADAKANGSVGLESVITAEGYLWGASPEPLLSLLPPPTTNSGSNKTTTSTSPSSTIPADSIHPTNPTPPPQQSSPSHQNGFDLLILADLLFNHSEHTKLLRSVRSCLKRSPLARALVFFTPYRPWLLEKDLAFFDLATGVEGAVKRVGGEVSGSSKGETAMEVDGEGSDGEGGSSSSSSSKEEVGGFVVEKVLEKVMDKVMFDDDPGDELLRRTVYGYQLKWSDL